MTYPVSEKAQRFTLNSLLHLNLKRGSVLGDSYELVIANCSLVVVGLTLLEILLWS